MSADRVRETFRVTDATGYITMDTYRSEGRIIPSEGKEKMNQILFAQLITKSHQMIHGKLNVKTIICVPGEDEIAAI